MTMLHYNNWYRDKLRYNIVIIESEIYKLFRQTLEFFCTHQINMGFPCSCMIEHVVTIEYVTDVTTTDHDLWLFIRQAVYNMMKHDWTILLSYSIMLTVLLSQQLTLLYSCTVRYKHSVHDGIRCHFVLKMFPHKTAIQSYSVAGYKSYIM